MACHAHATVVGTSTVNDDPFAFDSSIAASLITTGQPSLAAVSGTTPTSGFALAGVNNGSAVNGTTSTVTFYNTLNTTPATITFTLTQGYDITSIAALCGWGDSYFGSHFFSVQVEIGGSGTYTSIGNFGQKAYTPTAPAGFPQVTDHGFSIRTNITENTSGIIASNVTGIRFIFTDPYTDIPSINGTVIRELSVLGTATVPAATNPAYVGPIIPAAGEPTGSTRTDVYGAAGWGFYPPISGTIVNRLGYWDQGGDGLAISHEVMIVKYLPGPPASYTKVVRVTIPAGIAGRLENGYRWVSIPEIVLPNIGQGADFYGIVASHGTDAWVNGVGNGYPLTRILGTKQNTFTNGGGTMTDTNSVASLGSGYGGANFGYEPPTTIKTVADTRVKIMPLGDSITAGYTDNSAWNVPFEYGYRGPLATALLNSGVPFRFVGLSPEPFNNTSGDPTKSATVFPVNELRDPAINQGSHRGYGGWNISQINTSVTAWIAADDPDVILLHIGTNGIGAGSPAELNTLVGTIFTAKPTVKLVVAQIIPSVSYNATLVAYNDYIKNTLVPFYTTAGRNISTVDQYPNFLTNPAVDTSIDTSKFSNAINHPTNAAYGLMATTWLPAITPITLSSNSIPATAATGSTLATLTRLGAAGGETLTYSLVSGADSTDNSKFTIAGNQLKAGSHRFDLDPAGASYRIRIQVVGSVTGTAIQNFRLTRAVGTANPLAISIASINNASETAYSADVKNNDLLHGVAGTFNNLQTAGGPVGQFGNDGLHGAVGELGAIAWAAEGNASGLTYEIGIGNGAGYDVSSITTIAAWTNAGFMNQKYKVSVRYSGATEYVPAPECSVDYQPASNSGGGATKVTITRPGGMVFSRIEGIRFTCLNVTNNALGGSTTFREIDVVGAASTLTAYESYMKTNYPAIIGSGGYAMADPDGDGFSNLQEYAFGTDPGVQGFAPLTYSGVTLTSRGQPATSISNIPNSVDYRAVFGRRKDFLAAGLTYTVQFSAGLDIWVNSADTPTLVASDATMDAVSVPYPLFIQTANGVEKPTFFRVGVTGN
ncbi:MAG: hypothetical protein V4689_20190 [Verrucomicrobiota bacterium]